MEKRKILITGSNGFVGSRIKEFLGTTMEVIETTHASMDFTREEEVERILNQYQPDYFFHAGAISDTGACQKNPQLSHLVNVVGTKNIAKLCEKYQIKLIFCSSDQIYNGNKQEEPNEETMDTNPINVYGQDKKRAEDYCMEYASQAVALRLSWMYDLPYQNPNIHANFLSNLLQAKENQSVLAASNRDFRGITYVKEVIENLPLVCTLPGGIYNYGSENVKSTYDTMKEAMKWIGGDLSLIQIHEEYSKNRRNLSMNTQKANACGIHFSSTQDGINRCLKDYEQEWKGEKK